MLVQVVSFGRYDHTLTKIIQIALINWTVSYIQIEFGKST